MLLTSPYLADGIPYREFFDIFDFAASQLLKGKKCHYYVEILWLSFNMNFKERQILGRNVLLLYVISTISSAISIASAK